MYFRKIYERGAFPVPPIPVPRWKRLLDVSLVILAAPILLPLMVAVAILVRIVSEGPILFRQERVGYLGQRFMCFKFRTMFVNSDTNIHQGHLDQLMDSDAPLVKMDSKGDPRIIPFGKLLRATGLDELPQLLNVLRGEMSLVGPRPCLPYEYNKYQRWQKERFNTLPGLTGLWQVGGKNKTTFTEMICLDIRYARTRTLWLDLKILLKTLPAILIQVFESREPGEQRSFSPLDSAPASNLSRRAVRQ
jgi:exopolysaccharide production protein ExoY